MAVTADVIPRRPTLLFIVVLVMLLILMSLSSRTRYLGETRTLFERTVMTIFSPVPKTVNAVGQSTSDLYHGYFGGVSTFGVVPICQTHFAPHPRRIHRAKSSVRELT